MLVTCSQRCWIFLSGLRRSRGSPVRLLLSRLASQNGASAPPLKLAACNTLGSRSSFECGGCGEHSLPRLELTHCRIAGDTTPPRAARRAADRQLLFGPGVRSAAHHPARAIRASSPRWRIASASAPSSRQRHRRSAPNIRCRTAGRSSLRSRPKRSRPTRRRTSSHRSISATRARTFTWASSSPASRRATHAPCAPPPALPSPP